MLRYKTKTRPGLVALYDMQPGNGAGPFLQPRSPHGANDWSISIQSREQITIVYINFTKAFNLVSHQKLFVKLHSYGVHGVVLKWLQNFFTGRTPQTKINSSLSDIADLISGVV